jgi:hypothetical protein
MDNDLLGRVEMRISSENSPVREVDSIDVFAGFSITGI